MGRNKQIINDPILIQGGVPLCLVHCFHHCVILIHTPISGRNRRIYDTRTHSARCFTRYANQQQRLAYSRFHGIYIINNSCERYDGFMCALCSHSTVRLFIGVPPFYMYSISHCRTLPFSADEYRKLILLFSARKNTP